VSKIDLSGGNDLQMHRIKMHEHINFREAIVRTPQLRCMQHSSCKEVYKMFKLS